MATHKFTASDKRIAVTKLRAANQTVKAAIAQMTADISPETLSDVSSGINSAAMILDQVANMLQPLKANSKPASRAGA